MLTSFLQCFPGDSSTRCLKVFSLFILLLLSVRLSMYASFSPLFHLWQVFGVFLVPGRSEQFCRDLLEHVF